MQGRSRQERPDLPAPPGSAVELQRAGKSVASTPSAEPTGGFVTLDGEPYYRIGGSQHLEPFLISLASDSDLWLFVTSAGGVTAGRRDAEGSLFPYETVDRLHDGHHHTGPITVLRVERPDGGHVLWQPFGAEMPEAAPVQRNLYKNVTGNRIVFEEIHPELELAFRYRWAGCDAFGWVRTATLENRGNAPLRCALLDGLRNVLPYGADLTLYQQSSNLVDAYKQCEVDSETRLGIFSLTAGITDRAEAAEVLRANTVWCRGLEDFRVHLSLAAVADFRRGRLVAPESRLHGRRGNYLLSGFLELEPRAATTWHLAADVGRDHVQLAELRRRILVEGDLEARIEDELDRVGETLSRMMASADGLQATRHTEATVHHFANVLFNSMRGGIFADHHRVSAADLADFVGTRNRLVARRREDFLAALPERLPVDILLEAARATGDADLERLCLEYLPLHFARRHGDPSRPWNRFTIHVRGPDGGRILRYEGNWRDIFQNWEALCLSFPGFLPNVVAKFVNASTVDGFNPYRITRDGVDWETVEPDHPWSNIGYWGDHQIIYLLKLLEAMEARLPGRLAELLGRPLFSYADVPYRLKPYAEILQDPRATIDFDADRADRIAERVAALGSDGKLLTDAAGAVYRATLLEKLLVPALAKLSNLVPDGGIWMNTQRPEWNDANNALVGGGVSVVTLCYLRRYLEFLARAFDRAGTGSVSVSVEVVDWFRRLEAVFERELPRLAVGNLGDGNRQRLLDELGEAFSAYRETVYAAGFSARGDLPLAEAAGFCRLACGCLDGAIGANRRPDGLYHAYNLIAPAADGGPLALGRLQEMLEGQVAALSSGLVEAEEAVEILDRLYAGPLYRADQDSFLLYPERTLPDFLARNAVPAEGVRGIPLLNELAAAGDSAVLAPDAGGIHRFHGDLRNARDLAATLDRLAGQERWTAAVARDRQAVLDLFEAVFDHSSYTGRSGAMVGYEGLGCIYWHMVAKLLLAVQEVFLRAEAAGRPETVLRALAAHYYRVRAGLCFEKTVAVYGAFPTDPYSHTPPGGGAKQPGMTGQVKEEILTRFGELGVQVADGRIRFRPVLLRPREFLTAPGVFPCYSWEGEPRTVALPAGALAFTYCQVPIVYERCDGEGRVRVVFRDGSESDDPGDALDPETSRSLLAREGRIDTIRVGVPDRTLCRL